MNKTKITLTNDPLTNIHIMAPMLDKEGCRDACSFMLGLVVGTMKAKENGDKESDQQKKVG